MLHGPEIVFEGLGAVASVERFVEVVFWVVWDEYWDNTPAA